MGIPPQYVKRTIRWIVHRKRQVVARMEFLVVVLLVGNVHPRNRKLNRKKEIFMKNIMVIVVSVLSVNSFAASTYSEGVCQYSCIGGTSQSSCANGYTHSDSGSGSCTGHADSALSCATTCTSKCGNGCFVSNQKPRRLPSSK